MSSTANFKWTVLIYTTADEDLKPYLLRQLEIVKNQVITDKIQVVVQASLQMQTCSENEFGNSFERSGRYLIENKSAVLLEELENPDMTDPGSLLDFLLWGTKHFPSERLMLIVSGHSLGFAGLLAVSSDQQISLMSIPGFARALSCFKKYSGRKIDLLVLDTCFMDTLETTFEIALSEEQAVDYVLLSYGNPSLAGMPCELIINRIRDEHASISMDKWIAETIRLINHEGKASDLFFAIKLIPEYYCGLKVLIDKLSEYILHDPRRFKEAFNTDISCSSNNFPKLDYVTEIIDSCYPEISKYTRIILEFQQKMIITASNVKNPKIQNPGLGIFLPKSSAVYSQYSRFYTKLLFVDSCHWLQLLQVIHS